MKNEIHQGYFRYLLTLVVTILLILLLRQIAAAGPAPRQPSSQFTPDQLTGFVAPYAV